MKAIRAAAESGNETELPSLLSAAWDISKSIAAILQIGSGSASITLATTQERPMRSGTVLGEDGVRGISALSDSESSDA